MERCRTSLEQFLGDHREWAHLTADEVDMRKYTILLHVSLGLEKLHDMGVLHRDIKSSNILLDGEYQPGFGDADGEYEHAGKWKIGDFGQARVLKDPRVCFAEPCPWPAGWAAIPQLADRFHPVTSPVRSPETKSRAGLMHISDFHQRSSGCLAKTWWCALCFSDDDGARA
eukprot:COSAG01_NODE_11798_length_1857_cov_1.622867_2_plen_171_part_00